MGGGSSNSKLWSLFVNAELVDGSKYLAGDAQFRSVFIEYVRSGQWKDRLSNNSFQEQLENESFHSAELGNAGLKYICPPGFDLGMGRHVPETCVQSPRKRSFEYVPENLICPGFTTSQLTSIMFSVLYPLFASSPDDDCTPHSSSGSVCSAHAVTERAQEILASCAEELSEAEMDVFLEYPKWVFETSDTFEDFPLSITICDTARPGCPIIYANKAFQAQTGYTLVDLIGSGLDILNGPLTQEAQVKLMNEAVKSGQLAKIGVTHYNKKQKPFLNLVAMRSCANYSVAVHFTATPTARLEDLKTVDDLLLLVCSVLQAPLLKPVPAAVPATHTVGSLYRRSLALVKKSFEINPNHSSKVIRSSVSTKSTIRTSTSSYTSSFHSVSGTSDKSAINLARLMAIRMSTNQSPCEMAVRMSMNGSATENVNEIATERADEPTPGREVYKEQLEKQRLTSTAVDY